MAKLCLYIYKSTLNEHSICVCEIDPEERKIHFKEN